VLAAGTAAVVACRLNEDVRERQRGAELERSNRELEQFAHVASHDLVEPLRTVSGFLELLERGYAGALDERGQLYVRHARQGAARLDGMVADLLASSRAGRGRPRTEPVDMRTVVDDVLAAPARTIAERDARVDVGPLPVVRGDAGELRRLVQNLVANAIELTLGDRAPRVRAGAVLQDGAWAFAVVDDGVGIDPTHAGDVFRMFHRAGAGGVEGSGIGLGVCRRIVARHGGRIWAEPAPRRGAALRFTLPAV